ncbi:MAG: CAP domain-containing protein [Legionellaceae bacterium]|nr:CAP domain-containing protein [Legionellaceae bacterium]
MRNNAFIRYVSIACIWILSGFGLVHAESSIEVILHDINAYRAQHHVAPLTLNPSMNQIAQKHTVAMAQHHVGVGHTGFFQRVKELYHLIPHSAGAAENVAGGHWDAHQVVQGWIHSSGHRRNLLGHYQLTGIGLAQDARGVRYYTQIFLKTA